MRINLLGVLTLSMLVASSAASLDAECPDFPQKLDDCSPYQCSFTHPITQEKIERKIVGPSEGKCIYVEQMPNQGRMECTYSDTMRKAVAKFFRDWQKDDTDGKSYEIDGKKVANPGQEAMNVGECKVLGYGVR